MTVIDLSGQLDDICRRYPKYWLSDEAGVWGETEQKTQLRSSRQ
jgi:hypothetical protein